MPHISVDTNDPAAFIKFIRDEIRQGRSRTWELDKDNDLRHVGDNGRWRDDYYVRPSKSGNYAEFRLYEGSSTAVDRDATGIIMGALLSFIVRHGKSTKGVSLYSTIFYNDD